MKLKGLTEDWPTMGWIKQSKFIDDNILIIIRNNKGSQVGIISKQELKKVLKGKKQKVPIKYRPRTPKKLLRVADNIIPER